MMEGEGRNVLQPSCVSLASGLQRNSWGNSMHAYAAAHATVQLMRTPWLVPAPHSCPRSVWQLHTEHHSCSPSTL